MDNLKWLLIAAVGYLVYREYSAGDLANALTTGTAPATGTTTTSTTTSAPAPMPLSPVVTAAVLINYANTQYPVPAAGTVQEPLYTASQWNWFKSQAYAAANPPLADLLNAPTGESFITARQYVQLRSQAGLQGLKGLSALAMANGPVVDMRMAGPSKWTM